jgi:formylglycine-generating enzyme
MKRFQQCSFVGVILLGAVATCLGQSAPPDMTRIPDGVYRPLFRAGAEPKEVPVKAFCLDVQPVTTADFLKFVRANPAWRRSHVKRLFADEFYLRNWLGDLDPGTNVQASAPVTFVSWFAANAYAAWKGKRLPTVAEWEYAAAAGPASPDGSKDAAFSSQVLAWYNSPAPAHLAQVGMGEKNFWGVQDLHGLVWEWTADFNNSIGNGDARNDTGPDSQLFCGAGAQGARDVGNYPAFMRYGFRSSLKAEYCVHNLGFRCAADAGEPIKSAGDPCCSRPLDPDTFSGKSIYQSDSDWTTDAGLKIKLGAISGKPQVIVMFFAHCQSACPLLVSDLKHIEAALPKSLRGRVGFTLVSFDATRDTPAALKAYRKLRGLDKHWTLLTGNPGAVMQLAALLGVRYQQTDTGGFMHSNRITVLNAKGDIVYQQAGLGQDPEAAIRAIQEMNNP